MDLPQIFARPVARPMPYRTPLRGVYLCSASTPPGGGVHGMGGYFAARRPSTTSCDSVARGLALSGFDRFPRLSGMNRTGGSHR